MTHISQPEPNCSECPRLVAYRDANRTQSPHWYNGAVPSFGTHDARLLIVGLAPGLRGANATGRPFTGDAAGDTLYPQLIRTGFARGHYSPSGADKLRLHNCMITNAVRCVPPQNKPTTTEIKQCRSHLEAQLTAMPRLRVILTLGKIAHDSISRICKIKPANAPFKHGAQYHIDTCTIIASYHCSRYNTNTRRLTHKMFGEIFDKIRTLIDAAS